MWAVQAGHDKNKLERCFFHAVLRPRQDDEFLSDDGLETTLQEQKETQWPSPITDWLDAGACDPDKSET